jgi:hypothetical protein
MAEPNPGAEGPDPLPAQPAPQAAGIGGQEARLNGVQAKLQDMLRHHPVVLEQRARQAGDVQLRIAEPRSPSVKFQHLGDRARAKTAGLI